MSTLTNIHDNLAKQLQGEEHVFYINPAWNVIPSEEEYDRRIDYFIQNSPALDLRITKRICANYAFYCLGLWGARLVAENPIELAVAFVVFILVFCALFFYYRLSAGNIRFRKERKRSENRKC